MLFKLFGFIKDTNAMNTNGIGLGLVISENIVHKFEGKIYFDSVPEKGSTFTFTFKLSNARQIESREAG